MSHLCLKMNFLKLSFFPSTLPRPCCSPSHLSLTSCCYANRSSLTFPTTFLVAWLLQMCWPNARWSSTDKYSQKLEQIIILEILWPNWELKQTLKNHFSLPCQVGVLPRALSCPVLQPVGISGELPLTSVRLFSFAVCKRLNILLSAVVK